MNIAETTFLNQSMASWHKMRRKNTLVSTYRQSAVSCSTDGIADKPSFITVMLVSLPRILVHDVTAVRSHERALKTKTDHYFYLHMLNAACTCIWIQWFGLIVLLLFIWIVIYSLDLWFRINMSPLLLITQFKYRGKCFELQL